MIIRKRVLTAGAAAVLLAGLGALAPSALANPSTSLATVSTDLTTATFTGSTGPDHLSVTLGAYTTDPGDPFFGVTQYVFTGESTILPGKNCVYPDPTLTTTVSCAMEPDEDDFPTVVINLGSGSDWVSVPNYTGQEDVINGGPGNDTVFAGAAVGTINGDSGNDTIVSVGGRDINGGDGNDTITGFSGDDTITGGRGNDVIYGQGGNDTIFGNSGNDSLYGGTGNDHISGGPGNDVIYGNSGDDTLVGGPGADVISGGPGTNHITS